MYREMADTVVHPMRVLSKHEHKCITHIIHTADIHVRVGNQISSRVEEYTHVFDNFCENIAKLPSVAAGTALMVIAGDVFHNKGRMDAVAGRSFFLWINKLLDMVPILVICGNHDYRQEDVSFTDMVELFTSPYIHKSHRYDVHYLRDTGYYVYENVGFGLTSIKDTLRTRNTSGIVDELPEFPHGSGLVDVDTRVALFHGTISQSALPTGRTADSVTHGYPLDWFQGYDITMLGDNHKQQINTHGSMLWGYPGSLIQQDFGEPVFGHGYILWDIKKCSGSPEHIKNEYGALTVMKSNGTYMTFLEPKSPTDLLLAIKSQKLPTKPKLRVIGEYTDIQSVNSILIENGIVPISTKCTKTKADVLTGCISDEQTSTIPTLSDLNKPDEWERYIHTLSPHLDVHEWITSPSSFMIPDMPNIPNHIMPIIHTRNDKLRPYIESYDKEKQKCHTTLYDVHFIYMEWQYLMCYAKFNHFSFQDIEGKVALLNGANASGKSAFMDIISIALFGEPTSSRTEFTGSAFSSKIIYDGKPTGESAYVTLQMCVNDVKYEIYRTFTRQTESSTKDRDSIQNGVVVVYEINGEQKFIIAEGATMVSQWVQSKIGTSEEMIMSTMVCQQDNHNFFALKPTEQRVLMERALHIETITTYEKIIEESMKAHKFVLGDIVNYHKGLTNDMPVIDNIEDDHLNDELSSIVGSIEMLTNQSNILLGKIGNIEECLNVDIPDDIHEIVSALIQKQSALGCLTQIDKQDILKYQGSLEHRQQILKNTQFTPEGTELDDVRILYDECFAKVEAHMLIKPVAPSMTLCYIQETEARFDKWIAEQPPELSAQDSDTLRCKLEKLHTDLKKTVHTLEHLHKKHVQAPNEEVTTQLSDDNDLDGLYSTYKCFQKKLTDHIASVPACGRPLDSCDKAILLYTQWVAEQPKDFIADPQLAITNAQKLSTYISEHESCIDNLRSIYIPPYPHGMSKPNVDNTNDVGDIIAALETYNTFLKQIDSDSVPISPRRPVSDVHAMKTWTDRLSNWQLLVNNIRNSDLSELTRRKDELQDHITKYKSKQDELDALQKVMVSNDEEIVEISVIEFNPDCSACCKQPKCVRLNALKASQTQLTKKVDRITKQIRKMVTPSSFDNELATIEALILQHQEYNKNKLNMELEIAAWSLAGKEADLEAERKSNILALKTECDILAAHIWTMWNNKMSRCQAELAAAMAEFKIANQFNEQYPLQLAAYQEAIVERKCALKFKKWNDALSDIKTISKINHHKVWRLWKHNFETLTLQSESLKSEIMTYEKYITEYDAWYIELSKIHDAKCAAVAWDEWNTKHEKLMFEHDSLEWNVQRLELEADITKHQDRVNHVSQHSALENEIESYNKLISYREWKKLNEIINQKRSAQKDVMENIASKRVLNEQFKGKFKEHQHLIKVIQELTDRYERLQEFHSKFVGQKQEEGFKTYIYRERVLPLIQDEVNQFISTLDTFRLKIRMKGSRFIFQLDDRGNTPTLDHASGYQKFVVSLGMRVALSRIGAVGQNLKHLFLDEGFTACDSVNIQKTSDLLNDIMVMAGYKSMILMSHLDTIRDASNIHIHVKRNPDGRSSNLQYGERRMPIQKSTRVVPGEIPKKRGRPRKTQL